MLPSRFHDVGKQLRVYMRVCVCKCVRMCVCVRVCLRKKRLCGRTSLSAPAAAFHSHLTLWGHHWQTGKSGETGQIGANRAIGQSLIGNGQSRSLRRVLFRCLRQRRCQRCSSSSRCCCCCCCSSTAELMLLLLFPVEKLKFCS